MVFLLFNDIEKSKKTAIFSVKNANGYVLLAVLVFTQIYALLGITALENGFFSEKLHVQQYSRNRVLNESKVLLHHIENLLDQRFPPCVVPVISTNQLKKQSLTWWNKVACTGDWHAFKYYYVIEPLGEDACALIRERNELVADYWRITLLVMQPDNENIKVMLRGTMVRESEASSKCDDQGHIVHRGRQSYMEI